MVVACTPQAWGWRAAFNALMMAFGGARKGGCVPWSARSQVYNQG